jgi:predicted GNAT family acetyltransferase
MEQRVCAAPPPAPRAEGIVALGEDDVPEMRALAELTEPGPFRARTIALGGYIGVRDGARLVAMAGHRTRPAGHVELSAVCTHPDARGRGLAGTLVSVLAREVFARGETPFLGVRDDNAPARKLYDKLGFAVRRVQLVTVLKREI